MCHEIYMPTCERWKDEYSQVQLKLINNTQMYVDFMLFLMEKRNGTQKSLTRFN